MRLRDYQEKIVDSIRVEIKSNKNILVYAPTGAGKTKISQYIIEKLIFQGKKVLFTTPRIKLAIQTQKSFGFGNLILGNKSINNNSLCTIASVQSLYSRKITEHFDLIFIDECHFAHGSEYLNYIFKTYKNTKIIGLSATPVDENNYLLFGYDTIVNDITVKQLIDLNFLVDVEVYTSLVQPKTETIAIVNGDYNQTQASEIVRESTILSNTISEWQKLASKKKTLVFACDIAHAEELKKEFKNIGFEVDAVHSKMNEKDIEKSYKKFHKNEISILINVDMATFGFDEPAIECLLFARPIRSMRLFKQMIGRGLRPFKDKEKCLIIDCANVILENGFPTDEINFIKKPVINKTVDRIANVERLQNGEIDTETTTKERIEYLQKIGSLIDLYKNKIYLKEQDLVDDVKTILKRAGFFYWRQNSGMMFKDDRWIHFTDKKGLPDITLIFNDVYVGLELKLPQGHLTKYQKETLPEMINQKILVFIIENVIDLFECLEQLTGNIIMIDGGIFIKKEVYLLSENQLKYRQKNKLPTFF